MFIFLLTYIITLIKMATKPTRYGSSKENYHSNYILYRYLNEKYQSQKVYNPFCGMNDYQQSPQHKSKLSLPQPPTPQLLKRPLSSVTNTAITTNPNQVANSRSSALAAAAVAATGNNNYGVATKTQKLNNFNIDDYELNDELLKNNVAIVLNNLNQNFCNAAAATLSHHHHHQQRDNNIFNSGGFGIAMSVSPAADYNSNPYLMNDNNTTTAMIPIGCSIASSQDFTHDNSDYQWFLDYGYREQQLQHQSVLSSLSASYSGIGELSYYEDLAKNIDANLAEVDMESFRTEDIHSLLTKLPAAFSSPENKQKMSLNDLDNSICKSELLFSPVKESHISVDSLDMDGYPDEGDIILTCKANKDNYTIAFEGSAMYSDDSFYDGPEYPQGNKLKQNSLNLNNFNNKLLNTPIAQDNGSNLNTSMSKSENGYTTWSKLRQSNSALSQDSEHNCEQNSENEHEVPQSAGQVPFMIRRHLPHCFVNKSSSMPNLKTILHNQQMNQYDAISNSSVDSFGNQRAMLPHYPMPISTTSESESPNGMMMIQTNDSSNEPAPNAPSFNLVKLFIKQKSSGSTDTCMDVSSGCWPSDSTNSSSDHTNNNNNHSGTGARSRKKSMNDSGKGSALSRHDEEYRDPDGEGGGEFTYDSLDAVQANNSSTEAEQQHRQLGQRTNNTAVNSPFKRQSYKDLHLNIRNQLKHPGLYNLMLNKHSLINNNNNNPLTNTTSHSDTSRTSENLTQIFNINKSRTETMTRSIQTSFVMPTVMKENPIRVVPPSFLAKLNKESKREKSSVFVVYPNYALPDLEFVKTQTDVILSPVGLKEAPRLKRSRPVSLNDIDSIKRRQYGHVMDWKSLLTLLPQEYRKILKNIPEANEASMDVSVLPSQRPIFSMTPPIRQNRGVACDCAYILSNTNTNITSSSSGGSSSQPPSSGYRGSSTILTDSDMGEHVSGGGNNMYVYQYETEIGAAAAAAVAAAERPPLNNRAPKGILRRANTTRPRSKRSSMFEPGAGMSQLEKRRSLQEPFFAQHNHHHIIEDYIAEIESATDSCGSGGGMPSLAKNLLPNYPKQREVYEDHRKLRTTFDEVDMAMAKQSCHLLSRQEEWEARQRAEQFLVSVPKSELKHYAEIANILDTDLAAFASDAAIYNPYQLRSEVSRALSSQRKVSFIKNPTPTSTATTTTLTSPSKLRSPINQRLLKPNELRFTTPPNSPNMSVITAGKKSTAVSQKRDLEKEKQEKIQSNRFKRLQIQWELLSKDQRLETKSGGTTPTSSFPRSRIPRPVSYPSARKSSDKVQRVDNNIKTNFPRSTETKLLKSPSRIIPPKKYNVPAPTPTPRTPSKSVPPHVTPKKSTASSRPITARTR